LHLPRSQGAIREVVARLDRAALAAGGRVTRTLAQAVAAGVDRDMASWVSEDDVVAHAGTMTSTEADGFL
jgi:hypothetical protein